MFKAIAIINGEQVTIMAPSVEAMFDITCHMNFDVFVNGVQIKAQDGKKESCIGYFAGVTKSYLEALYKRGIE